jgi:GT2 family glycosyltransferase
VSENGATSTTTSVVIAAHTFERCEGLTQAVASAIDQRPQPYEVVVVVDNNPDLHEWVSKQFPDVVPVDHCGPRGASATRNSGARAACGSVLAFLDDDAVARPDWLRNLTAPLATGQAEYALGGTMVDPADHSVWDLASAPFFSIKLSPTAPTKSCTARSMAFTKSLWERIGGFPEQVLVGEDTLFDAAARRLTAPAFAANAKALYHPRNSWGSATHQMARYAISDGQARVRWARLVRNSARCLAQVLALVLLRWSLYPLLAVFLGECWFAFHQDWRFLPRFGPRALLARFAFSVAIPWVVAVNHLRGLFSAQPLTNRQNLPS